MADFRLKVFYAVATRLSFTKAASDLFITQPAVTKNIQELENELGLSLFERKGNSIGLTQAGKLLLDHAEGILKLYRQIEFDLGVLKGEFSGKLNLGASTTIAQYVLPPVLARFYRSFPGIRISMLNENTATIEHALMDHRIELGIVEGRTRNRELRYVPFMKDELVTVVSTRSKLALREVITADEFLKIPLVLREKGSGTLEVIEHALRNKGIRLSSLNIAMHLGSTESIKSFLAGTDCMGFVSIRGVAKEIAAGELRIIDIKDLQVERTFEFVHLQGQSEGLASLFMDFAMNHYNKGL
jgi:LysR family transcriptional regulator, transcriptional activator of the cysJI operon